MNPRQVVNTLTAFLMGAILMALVFVLVARPAGCTGKEVPSAPAPAVAPPATPAPAAMDAEEVERIARRAAVHALAAERSRLRDALCADPELPFEQRQILGCDGDRR